MEKNNIIDIATGGLPKAPPDWMPASQVHALVFEDPALLWLEYYGAQFGFQPDTSPYDFSDFIAEKSCQFEVKWQQEMAPGAPTVCLQAEQALSAAKVQETLALMQQGVPVIAKPALWWAPEQIYGVPDLLVHTAWLNQHFPGLSIAAAPQTDHYVVFDLKFTTKIEASSKTKDRQAYAAQVRLYSYMLAQMQGCMPACAYLVTRDHVADPFPVPVTSALGQPLDADLAVLRDQFIEIKIHGARYRPWQDAIVTSNPGNTDERWRTAKKIIATEKTPGRDAALLYQIGARYRQELAELGYPSLDALLKAEPAALPLESLKGIGDSKTRQMRAVLQANQTGRPVLPPPEVVPPRKLYEFFVDFEYFVNIDVDFEHQWPTLEGKEMIFMIGVGWNETGQWRFEPLAARAEEPAAERELFESFIGLLQDKTGGALSDSSQAALYHWTSAETWQALRAADRQALPPNHPLRSLPWYDLQKPFLNGPGALPGALAYGLKEFSAALGAYDPAFASHWPVDLDQGLNAMVMGWKAYRQAHPLQSAEFSLLRRYLAVDCSALERLLAWLRQASQPGSGARSL
jgi:predicted RecB family nuclease